MSGNHKLKKVKMFDGPNELPELPDCVISYILTKLSMKELLKTSILSKSWYKLWTLRRDLYFDIFNVFENTEEELLQKGYLIDVPYTYCSAMERMLTSDTSDLFVNRVDQFLKHSNATTIDSFLVKFYLGSQQQTSIDQWISFVIKRGIQTIDLLFSGLSLPYSLCCCLRNPCQFPFHLFLETTPSTLKRLRLQYCLVFHPTDYNFTSFKNLSFLSLDTVKGDEFFIETLLSNCKQLEELHLIKCNFESPILKIVSSSLCHLKVTTCFPPFSDFWEEVNLTLLDCLKLTSLEYCGRRLGNMNFNTPMLNNIRLAVIYSEEHLNAFGLLATLPKLEILQLDIYSMVPTSVKLTQRLQHLKELNLILHLPYVTPQKLDFDLSRILTILQACPLLQKLSVMLLVMWKCSLMTRSKLLN
ncbi:putative F-box/LRR-repeat protein At4g00320 isoform X2 [Vicia villosa]|uniref:putative F-box/LRR-repeat protein At4g00320 isoform X2 n=1 Tax=Vicia villosa TaxID=3911 RepID=UPI00273C40A0|nr:putative F-box/LRR-repeat protein At4g00320 isoform X2 [Vicia villosa]